MAEGWLWEKATIALLDKMMKPEQHEAQSISLRTKNILKDSWQSFQVPRSRKINDKNVFFSKASVSLTKAPRKFKLLFCYMQTNDFNDVQTCKLEKHFSPKTKLQFNQDINYDFKYVKRFCISIYEPAPIARNSMISCNDQILMSLLYLLYLNCDKMKIFSIHSARFWIEFHTTMQQMCERWIKFKLLRFRNQNCTHVQCRFN